MFRLKFRPHCAIFVAMKKDFPKKYRGFELVSEREIPDCSSRGIYLRHARTGLEVFHLLNDDSENLFAFSFRTPIKNSTGAAHITEHSVFCGSEKFPLKEPFTNMMNQSVNTFLNALTYSDKTVYPAASTLKGDYFNLMDVYADAVFFPLLKKEAFMQEAHRLEVSEDGGLEIQGVVYNEMKGSYSSFDSVATDLQLRCLFPDTNYAYDSGGDPIEIPSFTYENFKDFHKKHYTPENCLVFLYGNIPTEEQLDFLDEKLVSRLEKKYPKAAVRPSYPHVPEEFVLMETPRVFEKPLKIKKTAPSSGATGSLVTVNWNLGETADLESYMECAFLSELLIGNDGSPMSKALLDSDLGDEVAPLSGISNETRNFTMSFGLHGVRAKDEEKVYDLVFDTLKKVYEQGLENRDVEAAIMAAEFSNREVVRSGGPFSLVLLERTLNAWNYGEEPWKGLLYRSTFDKIRKKAEEDPLYVKSLLKKHLIENSQRVLLCVQPSDSCLEERRKAEEKILSDASSLVDMEVLKKELELLHSYQNHHETEEDLECIPHLAIEDLKIESTKSSTELSFAGSGSAEIPLFTNVQNTNGIAYLELGFPLDALKPSDYKYLTLFSYFATNSGWNGKDWAECALETAVHTGGIGTRLLSQEMPRTKESGELLEKYRAYNFCGRDWIFFSVRLLAEKAEEGVELFRECVTGYEFTDRKRMKNLLAEVKSVLKASVIPHGNKYASTRVQCAASHSGAVDEILKGFSQYFFLRKLSAGSVPSLSRKFAQIKKTLFDSGAVIHLTADGETSAKVLPLVERFAAETGLRPLKSFPGFDSDEFLRQVLLPGQKRLSDAEIFTARSQVGFAACSMKGSYFGSDENPAEILNAHWLSGNFLWERIRTSGGAYGAYAASANLSGQFIFSTFRDPSPFKSIETYRKSLRDAFDMDVSEEECLRSVCGAYGDEIQPLSPSAQGRVDFSRMLYCIGDSDRARKLSLMTKLTPRDMKDSARRLCDSSEKMRTVVFCPASAVGKSSKNSGVIVKLHL